MRDRPRCSKISSRYRAEVWVEKDGERVNGKSIMGLMMLAAGKGSKLHVIAEGADADKVVAEIENLVQTRFGEE
jgi:phosphocarrier protein HPr